MLLSYRWFSIILWADWAVSSIGGHSVLLRVILCFWTHTKLPFVLPEHTIHEPIVQAVGQWRKELNDIWVNIATSLLKTPMQHMLISKCSPSTPISILNSFQRVHLIVFCPDFLVLYSSNFSLLTPQTSIQPFSYYSWISLGPYISHHLSFQVKWMTSHITWSSSHSKALLSLLSFMALLYEIQCSSSPLPTNANISCRNWMSIQLSIFPCQLIMRNIPCSHVYGSSKRWQLAGTHASQTGATCTYNILCFQKLIEPHLALSMSIPLDDVRLLCIPNFLT